MSVFRELFVEVPIAILEAAIKEQLEPCEKTQEPPSTRLSIVHPDVWIIVFREAQDRFGWTLIGWERALDSEHIHVRVRLRCGHIGRFVVDEWRLASCAFSKTELVGYLLDVLETPPWRKCYCVWRCQ